MSPHDIAGPKCARYQLSKICAPRKSRPKFTKFGGGVNACRLASPLAMPNLIALGKDVREKRYKIVYTLQCFGAPGGPPVPKFTNQDDDE